MTLSVGIPSLARFKNRITTDISVWDGTTSTSLEGTGSIDNPYIISNGSDLAYLSQIDNTDLYFTITNNIILNNGTFKYVDDKIMYTIDNIDYYVKNNKYYIDEEYIEEEGSINILPNISNFKGTLEGNSYTIYGLYLNQDNAYYIDNLEGTISNLYIKNTLLTGKNVSIINKTDNSNINSLLFEGYLIGNSENLVKTSTFSLETLTITDNYSTTIPHNLIEPNIISVKLTGDYSLDKEVEVKINNNILTNNHFELNLDTDNLLIETIEEVNITFTNLTYEITYLNNISSVIANPSNSNLKNIINKGNIYSNNISSMIGILNNSNITNAYNNGITNDLVSIVKGTSSLTNVYNTYENAGLIDEVKGTLEITNSFNTSNTDVINKTNNSTITVTSSYVIDTSLDITNSFEEATIEELKSKEFMNTMYSEFISTTDLLENEDNIWLYIDDNYPLLYNDDITNPFINLHVKNYTYDSFSDDLQTFKFNENITFSIEDVDELNVVDKYYYIHNSQTPLTLEELKQIDTWTEYENILSITNEGYYIIYTKATNLVNTYYANSDLIVLDLSGSDVNIKLKGLDYSTLKEELDNVYINEPVSVTIDAKDELSGIKSIEYLVTNTPILEEELANTTFTPYESITINNIGKYIVYAKVVDNSDYVTYVNTDYIIYNGYTLNISSGSHNNTDLNITDKSKMTLKFNYDGDDTVTGNHNIVSNTLLPIGTIIKLKTNNKIYEYVVDDTVSYIESKAVYPFTLFKEKNKTNYYVESNASKEDIDITLDFKNTNISENILNVEVYLEIANSRSTLKNNIKKFNIYVDKYAKLDFNLNYNDTIIYNSDSVTNINITSGVNYSYQNETKIFDTTYEDKKQGIAIRMLDTNKNIVNSSYLKNIEFKIGDVNYIPENDNIIRIPISNNIDSVTKTLTIITHSNSAKLDNGNYYIEISNFTSYDGVYYDNTNNQVLIPVTIVSDNFISDKYAFDVTISDEKRIIPKSLTTLDFYVTVSGIENANVRVSLYQKDELTAYNQDYSIIDLNTYVENDLTSVLTNIYSVEESDFTINLNAESLQNTGYKFVFELYDGSKKISEISKYFIVR